MKYKIEVALTITFFFFRFVADQPDKPCDWVGKKPFIRCPVKGKVVSKDGLREIKSMVAKEACPVSCFAFNHVD